MTKSMTAFAQAKTHGLICEIRSVNQRYLDISFKLPEAIRSLEPELRNMIRQHLTRGKVDCSLRLYQDPSSQENVHINHKRLENLQQALNQINETFPNAAPPNALDILQWSGVLANPETSAQALQHRVKETFFKAIQSLVNMREREGAELARIILEKLGEVKTLVASVRQEVPIIQAKQQQKLKDRLAELKIDIDSGRLEQEIVYLTEKSDVAEELDRLNIHIKEIKTTLKQHKPMGRRLDFLMQELNREANTLASKTVAANTRIQAVELKVMIEQMREQIQNIE